MSAAGAQVASRLDQAQNRLEERAQKASEVEQRIKKHVLLVRTTWVRLAGDLFSFKDGEMWQALGYASFEEWLAGPEIDLSRRHVYGLIEAWRELVVERGVQPAQLEPVEVSKVREVLPAIRRGFVNAEEALSDAESLSRSDLRERYLRIVKGEDETGTRYDAEKETGYKRCPTCKSYVAASRLEAA